jgi:Family of unknown function (DUF6282)
MPTWSAHQAVPHRNVYLERMRGYVGTLGPPDTPPVETVRVIDEDGALLPDAVAIVKLCAQYNLTLASGHIPIEASLALATEAARHGVRFVLTHPLSGSVGASIDDQLAVVDKGGLVEHVMIGCMPMHQRADPKVIADAIRAVGAEHCIMASDAIEAWNPPAPEVMRMFVASMLALGIPDEDVHAMTHENPARALGLSAE